MEIKTGKPKAEVPISHAQYHELKHLVYLIGNCFHYQNAAQWAAWAKLRHRLSAESAAKIPASCYGQASANPGSGCSVQIRRDGARNRVLSAPLQRSATRDSGIREIVPGEIGEVAVTALAAQVAGPEYILARKWVDYKLEL